MHNFTMQQILSSRLKVTIAEINQVVYRKYINVVLELQFAAQFNARFKSVI